MAYLTSICRAGHRGGAKRGHCPKQKIRMPLQEESPPGISGTRTTTKVPGCPTGAITPTWRQSFVHRPSPVGRARLCCPIGGGPINRPICCRCPGSPRERHVAVTRHGKPPLSARDIRYQRAKGRERRMAWHGRAWQLPCPSLTDHCTALIRAPIKALSSKHQTFRRPIPPMFRAEISGGDRHGPPDPDPLPVPPSVQGPGMSR